MLRKKSNSYPSGYLRMLSFLLAASLNFYLSEKRRTELAEGNLIFLIGLKGYLIKIILLTPLNR
jgi:hypothetical protein